MPIYNMRENLLSIVVEVRNMLGTSKNRRVIPTLGVKTIFIEKLVEVALTNG